jgi:hypothetical protein
MVNEARLWLSSETNFKSFLLFILRFRVRRLSCCHVNSNIKFKFSKFSDISLSSRIIAVALGYVWILIVAQGPHHRVAPRELDLIMRNDSQAKLLKPERSATAIPFEMMQSANALKIVVGSCTEKPRRKQDYVL